MIGITLDVERIDYDKSVEGLLPSVLGWIAGNEKLREADKFVKKLGPDAVPVVKKLLGYLDGDTKDEIIVWLLSRHREQLTRSAAEYLDGVFPGVFRIGEFSAENKPGSRLIFRADRVEVHYASLLDSPLVSDRLGDPGLGLLKGAAKLLTFLPQDKLEEQGIALLQAEPVRTKILSALQAGFEKAGLYAEIRSMTVKTGEVFSPPPAAEPEDGLIPDAFEDALFDGVAAWLRGTL